VSPRAPQRRYLDDVAPLVDAVPSGRVLTYGDVAELTGWGAARAVGAVMSRHGHELPWWRVVRADGSLPEGLLPRARLHWAEEGTPLRQGGAAVDLALARWDAAGLDAPGLRP
jgi:alkylated DNA nucleotide flippase Atl1